MPADALLIVADGANCANLRYAAGLALTRPAVFLQPAGAQGTAWVEDTDRRAGHLGPRECRVRALPPGASGSNGRASRALASAIARWVRARGVRRLMVPESFPLGLAQELATHKLRLRPCPDCRLFPERAVKTAAEVAMIRAAVVMAEVGLAEGIHVLQAAQISGRGRLTRHGQPLTAERLRMVMQVAVFQAGGLPVETTVEVGPRAGEPAAEAQGPLPAHRPIALSLTTRSHKTGYHASLTRTMVRGRAREEVRHLHAALLQGLNTAVKELRAGSRAATLFTGWERGLLGSLPRSPDGRRPARPSWSVEAHGIGLERRELPFLGTDTDDLLHAGNVLLARGRVTGSRGGGVALADLLLVTPQGCRCLTLLEKVLEL